MKKFEFNNTNEYAEYIKEQANALLDKCEIYGDAEDRNGLMDNIMMSIEAKAELFEIFENSPCHNGKGQLILPMEIERPIDEDVIYNFANYISKIAEKYYLGIEAVIDGYTYRTAYKEHNGIERLIRTVNYMNLSDDEVVIKGKPFSEYRNKFQALKNIIHKFDYSSEYYNVYGESYTTMENKKLYDKAQLVADAIRHCIGHQLEDSEDIEKLSEAFPRSQCREGIKISKVVQKCLKELGLYQIVMENDKETYNKKYAKWTDAVTPKTITKWSVLSINFVDFLTMSHGHSWTSCLNTDKRRYFTRGSYSDGFNSRRTLDYALDPTTMVFYTIDENYDGDDWELQPKLTRQLFHFGENKLIQARLYPQSDVSRRNIYTQYRENVEQLLADAMGEANLWSAPVRGTMRCHGNVVDIPYDYDSSGSYIDFLKNASHGGDEHDFQSEVNYVVFRGSSNREDNGQPMTIGSTDAICIMCGDSLREGYSNSIACEDCY